MKIKTITCHKVYNHGAYLQEYALLKYLEGEGHEAEVINYTPPYLSNHHNLLNIANPRFGKNILLKVAYLLLKLPNRLLNFRRKWAFDNFEKQYLKCTEENYKTNEELKNNPPIADVYICGSDQIWNTFFQNGKDPSFYLDFVPAGRRKVSYAASFAIDKIDSDLEPFVADMVGRLDKVSVRESSGQKILKNLGVESELVLDPVFLLDKEYWESEFVTPVNDNFIFVYDCDTNPGIEKIVKHAADKYDLKIFTVNENIKYADKNFYLKGPETFLSLIHNAKFIISNSFHAVAFSLIFNKEFFVVDRSEKINTRMRDILKLLNLEKLHLGYSEYKEFEENTINYTDVNTLLYEMSNSSKTYLKDAIYEV